MMLSNLNMVQWHVAYKVSWALSSVPKKEH